MKKTGTIVTIDDETRYVEFYHNQDIIHPEGFTTYVIHADGKKKCLYLVDSDGDDGYKLDFSEATITVDDFYEKGIRLHYLKTWTEIFQKMESQEKKFDIRKNDRDFKVGEILVLQDYDPINNKYLGGEIMAEITYIMDNNSFINLEDKVILSLNYITL